MLMKFKESISIKKNNTFNENMLIMGLSATADESEQLEGFEYGMHVFCNKPPSLLVFKIVLTIMKSNSSLENIINELNQHILYDKTFHTFSSVIINPKLLNIS